MLSLLINHLKHFPHLFNNLLYFPWFSPQLRRHLNCSLYHRRYHLFLYFGIQKYRRISINFQQIRLQILVQKDITPKKLKETLFSFYLLLSWEINKEEKFLDFLENGLGILFPDLVSEDLPSFYGFFASQFIIFVFALVTVVGQMFKEFRLILEIFLGVFVQSPSDVPRIEHHQFRSSIDQHITSNIKLIPIQQIRSNIMLNQSIMLNISILRLPTLLNWRIQFWFVIDHIVQSELTEIEFLGFQELVFELFDVGDELDSFALVAVPGFVDPEGLSGVVDELDLIGHDIESVGFGEDGDGFEVELGAGWDELVEGGEELGLDCDDVEVRDMVDQLLAFLKREIINFGWCLHPFEMVMRRELLLVCHQREPFALQDLLDKSWIISFPYIRFLRQYFLLFLHINFIDHRISKHWEFITNPIRCLII